MRPHLLRPAADAGAEMRWCRILPPTAGVLAIALQWGAFTALANVARESAELERQIDVLPEKTVVTDVFFLPEQTPHLFFTKDILQFDDAPALLRQLRTDGRREFILLLSTVPGFRRISNEQLALLLNAAEPKAPPMRFSRSPGSGFMDLHIVRCRLK